MPQRNWIPFLLTTAILLPIAASLAIPLIPDPGNGKNPLVRPWRLANHFSDHGWCLPGLRPDVAGLQLRQVILWVPDLGLGCRWVPMVFDAADPAHQLHHHVGSPGGLASEL